MCRQKSLRRVSAWRIRMSAGHLAQKVLSPGRWVDSFASRDFDIGEYSWKASIRNQTTDRDEIFVRTSTERRASLMLLRKVCEETIRRIDKELVR